MILNEGQNQLNVQMAPIAVAPIAGRIHGMLIWHESLPVWEDTFSGRKIPLNEEIYLIVIWVNESEVNIVGHIELSVTYPDGTKQTLSAVLNQDRDAVPRNGWSVQFAPFLSTQEGTYTLEATLSSGGETLDSVTFTLVSIPEPEPEPEPEPTTVGTVSGIVYQSVTNTPLENAVVRVRATFTITNPFTGAPEITDLTGYTDENGRYEFSHLPTGVYIISASASGHESVEGEVTIPEGTITLNIYLAAITPPDYYALSGGSAKGYNDNGSWRSLALNYWSKYGYPSIPVLFKAYKGSTQYSVDFVGFNGAYSYRIDNIGISVAQHSLPRRETSYWIFLSNYDAIKDMHVRMYLGKPEGGWKLVATLG